MTIQTTGNGVSDSGLQLDVAALPVWVLRYEWDSEDEAIHDICVAEQAIRRLRWEQWDRCLAFQAQFGYGAVLRLADELDVTPRTINNYIAAARIPPALRVDHLSNKVYYRAARDPDGLEALETVVSENGTSADFWALLAVANGKDDDPPQWEDGGEFEIGDLHTWRDVHSHIASLVNAGRKVRVRLEIRK